MLTVRDILDKKGSDVASVSADETVLAAAREMNTRKIGAVVVTTADSVVGIFTERDVLTRVVAEGRAPDTTLVKDVMTTPIACCKRSSAVRECRGVMTERRIRHLPVVEDGRLYGMISSGDILAQEAATKQETIEYLHQYLYGRV